MTDIIKTVLSLIFDKARDVVSSELSEGDLTHETFRKLIAREINEINKKLDALGRKDLLSSVQFLKEGLNRLLMAMQKKSMNSDEPTTSRNTPLDTLTIASTSQRRVNEAFTISNVLAKKFEVVSLECSANAKESFKESRKEATRAFSNEALSIDDRIMATELRIVSRILESFPEDPDDICSDCLLYLQELHSLPAVREMYSDYVDGKSLFNRKERKQKVETIESINSGVLDFIAGFTSEEFRDSVNWPTIQLRNERKYEFFSKKKIAEKHAELNERRRMKTRWPDIKIGTTLPKRLDLIKLITINKGIFFLFYYTVLTKNFATCAWSLLMFPHQEIDVLNLAVERVLCLVTDASNWVYVLVYNRKWLNLALVFTIFVFDSNGMFFKCITTDISCGSDSSSSIGVFAMQVLHGKIAVLRDQFDSRRVNFIDVSTGETYHTIFLPHPQVLDSPVKPCINILNDSEIMVTRSDDKAVCIYTNEGQLKQTIHLPLEEAFTICDIAYRAASEEVLVFTRVSQDSESLITRESNEQLSPKELLAYRLLVYSTNGTPEDTYCLSRDSLKYVDIVRPYFSCLESEIFWVKKGFEYVRLVRKKIGL